ncbi:uncharacterized protein ACRADG_012650 [Cochliomyia hominivorax]
MAMTPLALLYILASSLDLTLLFTIIQIFFSLQKETLLILIHFTSRHFHFKSYFLIGKVLIAKLNICKQVPGGTQPKQEKILLNHISTTKSFTSKWRKIHDRNKTNANKKLNKPPEDTTEEPQIELKPLRPILKNSKICKDAYYHTLTEAEFDAAVLEHTNENKINKPSIRNILKKHDNLKTVLKQAQQMEANETKAKNTQTPNHKSLVDVVEELRKLKNVEDNSNIIDKGGTEETAAEENDKEKDNILTDSQELKDQDNNEGGDDDNEDATVGGSIEFILFLN